MWGMGSFKLPFNTAKKRSPSYWGHEDWTVLCAGVQTSVSTLRRSCRVERIDPATLDALVIRVLSQLLRRTLA